MRTKLTAAYVHRLEPREAQYEVTDAATAGLVLRVQRSGVKRWGYRYKAGGRVGYLVLGGYPELSLEGARIRARKRRQDVHDGKNPAEERNRSRLEPTLGELWATYRADHTKRPKTLADDLRRWTRQLARWEARKVSQVTSDEVRRLLSRIARDSGPYEANRVLSLLRHLYRWSISQKLIACPNPCADLAKPGVERTRERTLAPAEVARLRDAIAAEDDPIWRGYFMLLIFTGCRRSELLSACWDWVRLDADPPVLDIPRESTKQDERDLKALSGPAVEIIAGLPSRGRSAWLFPSEHEKGGPRTETKRAWQRIRERAELEDLRVHDLRHAVASSLGSANESAFIIKSALGHRQIATTERYTHPGLAATHRALERHGERVMRATAEPKEEAEPAPSRTRMGARREARRVVG